MFGVSVEMFMKYITKFNFHSHQPYELDMSVDISD